MEKTFEEQFPSLKNHELMNIKMRTPIMIVNGGIFYSQEALKDHCLDKQRVKELIMLADKLIHTSEEYLEDEDFEKYENEKVKLGMEGLE